MLKSLVASVIAAACIAACGERTGHDSAPGPDAPVRVFAAASLTDVLGDIGAAYSATGRPAPVFNFAASSDLARQIEQGADADIFMSADEDWMDYLEERNLVAVGQRRNLLSNALVLIAPADGAFIYGMAPGEPLAEKLGGGVLAIADPASVPAGRYARQSLEWLGAWDGVKDRTAHAENVRSALRLVQAGEAAAGIVYLTDALAAKDTVALVGTFPPESHAPIVYPVAPMAGREAWSSEFIAFLTSAEARALFESAGFGVVPLPALR